ncbi:SPX domain-containing protein [Chlamydoabsidia padenii]|nr:SPX domain-containing protein [Chlamydoabsidia padenii]
MKFAKHLEAESVSEWRKAYINYKGLKKRLTAIEKYRHANAQALNTQINNAQLKHALQQINNNDSQVSLETTSARYHPGQTQNIMRRPKRYNTTPTDFEDYRQERQDSFSKSIMERISSSLFRGDTELGSVDSSPVSLERNILDQVLTLTNEPERYFFAMLDQELEKISRFYDKKEQEAVEKFEALKIQLELIKQYRRQLLALKQSEDGSFEQRLNPMHWFHPQKPLNSTIPTSAASPPAIVLDGDDYHISYRVARSRLKTAITEYYRSLELLRSYKVLNEMGFHKILKKFDKVKYIITLNH